MEIIDWKDEVEAYRATMIREITDLVSFKSVYDRSSITDETPYGIENKRCLHHMLHIAKEDGFITRNYDNHAGRIEFGPEGDIVGVACHLDVVQVDGKWESDPFVCTQKGNVLYGRGTNDNKGPTIAVYTALRILAQSDWIPTKKLHLILGCNEESGMKDMDYYVSHTDRMPDTGFVPDCTFPVNYGEHGSGLIEISVPCPEYLTQFESSLHPRTTCGSAFCALTNVPDHLSMLYDFYIGTNALSGEISCLENQTRLSMVGKSAHGSRPYEGINAAYHLLNFVFNIYNDRIYSQFIQRFQQTDGTGLNIRYKSYKTGDLSIALTGCSIKNHRLVLLMDCRYPSNLNLATIINQIQQSCTEQIKDVQCVIVEDSPGFYVDPNSTLVTKLQTLYQTMFNDDETQSKVSPGCTYARKFKNKMVAFGPTTRNHLRNKAIGQAHQINEGMDLDILMKATEVYIESLRLLLDCVKRT